MEAKPALGERLLEERQTGSSSHLLLMDNWLQLTPFILVLQIENSPTSAILRRGQPSKVKVCQEPLRGAWRVFLSLQREPLWTAS